MKNVRPIDIEPQYINGCEPIDFQNHTSCHLVSFKIARPCWKDMVRVELFGARLSGGCARCNYSTFGRGIWSFGFLRAESLSKCFDRASSQWKIYLVPKRSDTVSISKSRPPFLLHYLLRLPPIFPALHQSKPNKLCNFSSQRIDSQVWVGLRILALLW